MNRPQVAHFLSGVPAYFPSGARSASHSLVTIDDFGVLSDPPRAFVVMRFTQLFNDVYLEVIKSVCNEFGVSAIRADEVYGPGMIVKDIIDQVTAAQLVIADISEPNANVYFEVGYALALNKPSILLAKKDTPLPFDVSGFRVLFYEDSIGGKPRVEEGLRNHLRAILGVSGS
jgi:hypothetical protein